MPTTIRNRVIVGTDDDSNASPLTLVELVALVDALPARLVDAARVLNTEPRVGSPEEDEETDDAINARSHARRVLEVADVRLDATITADLYTDEPLALAATWVTP